MLLRTRVIVFVLAAFLGLATLVGLGLHQYVGMLDQRLARASSDELAALWTEMSGGALDGLEREGRALADGELAKALAAGDRDRVAAIGEAARRRLEGAFKGVGGRIDILRADGRLFFTTAQSVFPEPLLPSWFLATPAGGEAKGALYDRAFGLATVVAIPVRDAAGALVGRLVAATGLENAVRKMERGTGSSIVVVNRRGRAIAGADGALWGRLNLTPGSDVERDGATLNGRVYGIVRSPIDFATGAHAADLVAITDRTAQEAAERRVVVWTVGASVGVVALMLAVLFLYLRHSFRPLATAVRVLDAVSSGDTAVSMEGMAGPDEVGSIAHTVEIYRRRTMALQRMTRTRARQRRRQERLIIAQMAALAGTLDDDARDRVNADLEEIKAKVAAGSAPDSAPGSSEEAGDGDGLEVTALALSKLTRRITDQQNRLVQLIDELREALKSKTTLMALRKELDIAASIQSSVLPKPMPPHARFQIAGRMIPAKEIGGDFYDFFFLDERRLALVVADVSGKGVPAAFFMAIARTLMRALTLLASAPGEAVAKLNQMLAEDNDEGMFVTLFYGVLDLETGALAYVSGGHNPPILRRADGTTSYLPATGGMALGVVEGLVYREASVRLEPDDLLILYTDGVTEAQTLDDELFGEARLEAAVASAPSDEPTEVLAHIVGAVRAFEGEAPQADDLTAVALRLS